ncbi:MAG TPA: amino acid permease [Myxococcota bacterium]
MANVAEEATYPQRDLSRGFISAMLTLVVCAGIALFGATGVGGWKKVLYVDGVGGATSDSPLPMAVAQVVGVNDPLFALLTGIGLLGLIASFHGIILASSRAVMEMGRTGYFPAVVGALHKTRATPVNALIVGFVIGMAALFTGKTGDIILLAIFGALTLYIASTLALFKLRRSEPDLERPWKTPLYPVVPALALLLSVVGLVAMLVTHPALFGIYAALLVVGAVVWWTSTRAARGDKSAA